MLLSDLVDIPACLNALRQQGYYVVRRAAQTGVGQALAGLIQVPELQPQQAAGIGRAQGLQVAQQVRSDKIRWLDAHMHPLCGDYLQLMQQLQQHLNQAFYLGLAEFEGHLAYYPEGAFYAQHKDAFADAPAASGQRKISCIFYLNAHWQAEDGGELVMYCPNTQQEITRILPQLGTLVLFLSEEFPHEVRPTHKPRWSLTGWFRTRAG